MEQRKGKEDRAETRLEEMTVVLPSRRVYRQTCHTSTIAENPVVLADSGA